AHSVVCQQDLGVVCQDYDGHRNRLLSSRRERKQCLPHIWSLPLKFGDHDIGLMLMNPCGKGLGKAFLFKRESGWTSNNCQGRAGRKERLHPGASEGG